MQKDIDYKKAHQHCIFHRKEIEASNICGCFYCLAIFPSSSIEEWTDDDASGIGTTALCPKCGIDSVLGDRSGYTIEIEFLKKLHEIFF